MRRKFTAHICYACHIVRACRSCCAGCRIQCNGMHYCNLRDVHMTEDEGWEWFISCSRTFDLDRMRKYVPEDILRKVEERMRRGVEQQLEFHY